MSDVNVRLSQQDITLLLVALEDQQVVLQALHDAALAESPERASFIFASLNVAMTDLIKRLKALSST